MTRGRNFAGPKGGATPLRAVGLLSLLLLLAGGRLADAADPGRFRVDPEQSRIDVKVGTAGLFRFAGHDHGVRVKVAQGEIVAASLDLAASSVVLVFRMADVRVTTTEGPADEIPKVQEKMAGPAVLDAARFPEARFRSLRVKGKSLGATRFELDVAGELSLHGVTRPVSSHLVVDIQGERLVARGQAILKQTDFGMTPVSVAGVVKVKDELSLDLEITALRSE
jgi:polyisoprenoid-binding protein YceI